VAEIDIQKLYKMAGKKAPELAFQIFDLEHSLSHNWEVETFFENSSIKPALRKKVFDMLYPKPSALFKKLVYLLIDQDLMNEMPELSEKFAAVVSKKARVDFAELRVSAMPDPSLVEKVKKTFGRGIKAKVIIDPELIGGFFLKFLDGRTFDGSLKGKLERLRSEIMA